MVICDEAKVIVDFEEDMNRRDVLKLSSNII